MTNKQKRHALKKARARLQLKLKMERPFIRELKSYFARSARAIAMGQQIDTVEPVLEKHYNRIVRNMTGIKLKQEEEDDYGLEDAILLLLMGRATIQALGIDKTTRKLLRRAEELARQELADDGILFPAASTLNRTTANIFKTLSRARPGGIATTETQMLTEKIQDVKEKIGEDMMGDAIVEGNTALGNRAADMMESMTAEEVADDIGKVPAGELFAALAVLTKTWVTMGDSKVRPAHQDANFQVVPRGEPFLVMGQNLMYPGDTSMGATMDNVARCRCSSVLL